MRFDEDAGKSLQTHGIFAIRGDLDGELQAEFAEKEQFIGLKIASEEFYLPITLVREIVMLVPITFVPQSPKFIEGVVNLRGTILPVVNLRKMMGLKKGAVTAATRIIIVRHGELLLGILVDAITYVVALHPSEIEVQSLASKNHSADLISRIAKGHDHIAGILDLGKIVHIASQGRINLENPEALSA